MIDSAPLRHAPRFALAVLLALACGCSSSSSSVETTFAAASFEYKASASSDTVVLARASSISRASAPIETLGPETVLPDINDTGGARTTISGKSLMLTSKGDLSASDALVFTIADGSNVLVSVTCRSTARSGPNVDIDVANAAVATGFQIHVSGIGVACSAPGFSVGGASGG
jgi:hypothetical protein